MQIEFRIPEKNQITFKSDFFYITFVIEDSGVIDCMYCDTEHVFRFCTSEVISAVAPEIVVMLLLLEKYSSDEDERVEYVRATLNHTIRKGR